MLNDIAVQEIASLKAQYQRLLQDQEDERARPSSARAVIITGKGTTKEVKRSRIKKQPSKSPIKPIELKNPQVPSIEEFIDQEKAMLLERIQSTQYL